MMQVRNYTILPTLTCDVPPALSTAMVKDGEQQATWTLKKDPRKLLQPRANISCPRTWMYLSCTFSVKD